MSQKRGKTLPKAIAEWLQQWWPDCEATPNGRNGRDILRTPGVAFEIKTSGTWRAGALEQARLNAGNDLPVVLHVPPGVGERNLWRGMLFVMPAEQGMRLLEEAGYIEQPPCPECGSRLAYSHGKECSRA